MSEKRVVEGKQGIFSLMRDFLNEPLPKGVGWTHVFGSILLFLVVLQILTGILLAIYYSPAIESAYESVSYIDNYVFFGKFIRGLHHWSASAFVIVLVIHILRTFIYSAYKPPRQFTWVGGVCLLLITLAFAFTGYLLPWDMKAYFATRVGIEVAASAPFWGDILTKLLKGGSELGSFTLTRFYAIHVIVLPLVLILMAGMHLYYVRIHKITPPWKRNDEDAQFKTVFFPKQFAKDQIALTVIFVIIAVLAVKFGAPLEAKADPTDTSYVPRPDWYFFGLYQLLRIFQGKFEIVGTIVLPTLFFAGLFALPFIDKNPERAFKKRRVVIFCGLFTFFVVLFLTIWGGVISSHEVTAAQEKQKKLPKVSTQKMKPANPAAGSELFKQLRCGSCHETESRGINIPPGLEFIGDKFQEKWLVEFLLDPYRIRWADTNVRPVNRMPNFNLSKEEARNVAAFLMQNIEPGRFAETGIDWSAADSIEIAEGKQLVSQYACTGCHVIADGGTNLGPELSHVGSKLQPDYIYHLILTPQKVIPETPMKDNQLWEDEAATMVRYLKILK